MPALYDRIGANYAQYRRPDPRIEAAIVDALGSARTIVNVGAGTGSYEPQDRDLVAVEPSETMIRQRRGKKAAVVRASALALPFADGAFDAAMAILTVHHWPDQERGLRELGRVAKRCVIFTCDATHPWIWLIRDYFPEAAVEAGRILPPLDFYRGIFRRMDIRTVPVPHDCSDGFFQAYWRRPQAYLDANVRRAISYFAKRGEWDDGLAALKRDLEDGTWMRRNGHLMDLREIDAGYRLIVAES